MIRTEKTQEIEDPYIRLLAAIVISGIKSWRRLYRRQMTGRYMKPSDRRQLQLDQEFLVDILGEYRFNKIKEGVLYYGVYKV